MNKTQEKTTGIELDDTQEKILSVRRRQLDEIRQVVEDQKTMTRGQLEAKYEAFAEKYPKTWVSLMDGNLHIGHLERNIEAYETMFRRSNGRTYKEKKFQADMQFGEKLAQEYLYPTTGRPDQKMLDKAQIKARKQLDEIQVVKDKSQLTRLDFDGE